jgi:HSP20 family protein
MVENKTEIQKKEAETVEQIERTRSVKVFCPAVDILETKDEINLIADMPGVDKQSIDITIEKDVLSLSANVKSNTPEGFSLDYIEYEVGDYQRQFTLSDAIDQKKIKAQYKDGVLTLKLPKAEPVKPKTIKIEAE